MIRDDTQELLKRDTENQPQRSRTDQNKEIKNFTTELNCIFKEKKSTPPPTKKRERSLNKAKCKQRNDNGAAMHSFP